MSIHVEIPGGVNVSLGDDDEGRGAQALQGLIILMVIGRTGFEIDLYIIDDSPDRLAAPGGTFGLVGFLGEGAVGVLHGEHDGI